jgi:hypothetical protein
VPDHAPVTLPVLDADWIWTAPGVPTAVTATG